MSAGLCVLAVDDEPPALDEMEYLLRQSGRVREVVGAGASTEALRHLREQEFDAVFLDIAMPGLDGLELASVLSRFAAPPAVVFVTAHEEHALEAFDVGAAGYLLKPLDPLRLGHVLGRLEAGREPDAPGSSLDLLPVDVAGRIIWVARSEVAWVESAGDYVRLHTFDGKRCLVRHSMTRLETVWSADGFARIHRQYLICLRAVRELRTDGSQTFVTVLDRELPVSRRHLRELRDRLVRNARTGR